MFYTINIADILLSILHNILLENKLRSDVVIVVVGFKVDSLTGDLGLWVGCPPWGCF